MLYVIRQLASLVAGTFVISSLVAGCSGEAACQPQIKAGSRYKVTLLTAPDGSPLPAPGHQPDCKVAQFLDTNYYFLTAGETRPSASDPTCDNTPAATPPPVMGVTVETSTCAPSETGMLGIACHIVYPGGCKGVMTFDLISPNNQAVNWNTARIDGLVLRIQDSSENCFANFSMCLNQYLVSLERA